MGVENTASGHPVPAEAAEADHVLVLGPESGVAAVGETCVGLLACEGPAETSVLTVALVDSPDERVESWLAHESDLPVRMQFLSGSSGAEDLPEPVGVTRISNPRDLPRLGITLVDMVDELGMNEERIALCFRSLTVLLQYAGPQQVFRFVQTLKSRTNGYGLRTHFHLDPAVVEEQAIATLESLFDAVVEVDEEGHLHVR